MQADFLLAEPPGKPKNTGADSLSLLQWIYPGRNRTGSPALQADSLPSDRNANQNYNAVSSHAGQNGRNQKVYKQCWRGRGEKGTLLVGMQTSTATIENSAEIP